MEEAMILERMLLQIARVSQWIADADDECWARQCHYLTHLQSVDCSGSPEETRAYLRRCELICSWPARSLRRRLKKADMANYRFVRRAFNPRPSDWW